MTEFSEQLADHYDDPYHRGDCENATHAAELESAGCRLRFEVHVDEDSTITEAWFDGQGCCNCEGLSSILAGLAEGQTSSRLLALSSTELLHRLGKLETFETACLALPLVVLQSALQSPVVAMDGDLADGTSFGGPSLREEC